MSTYDSEFEDLHSRIRKYLPLLKVRLPSISGDDPSAYDLYSLAPHARAESVQDAHLKTSTAFRSPGFSSKHPDEVREIRNVLEKSRTILTDADKASAYVEWLSKRRGSETTPAPVRPRPETSHVSASPRSETSPLPARSKTGAVPVAAKRPADGAHERATARKERIYKAFERAEGWGTHAVVAARGRRMPTSTSSLPPIDLSLISGWRIWVLLALIASSISFFVPVISLGGCLLAVLCGGLAWHQARASTTEDRRRTVWMLGLVGLLLLAIAWKHVSARSESAIPRHVGDHAESRLADSQATITSVVSHAQQQDGYLQGKSGADIARLYYRDATGKENDVDCSPNTPRLPLPPGRYFVRIVGVRNAIIAHEHEIIIRRGQTQYLGPD